MGMAQMYFVQIVDMHFPDVYAAARPDNAVFCGSQWLTWNELFLAATIINADKERFGKELLAGAFYPKKDVPFN